MLRERKPGSDGTSTAAATSNNNNIITDDDANNANSAGATAISCRSEQDLRVACFCEENVWRLAYRRLFGASSLSTASSSSSSSSSVLQLTNSSTIDKENEEYYVVFVSNDEKCCPMLNQKASRHVDEPCFWDYHVILIQCSKQQKLNQYHHLKENNNNNNNNNNTNENENAIMTQVLDMDSRLSYPCPLDEYLNETFSKLEFVDVKATKKYAPKFRVIRAELYLKNFYSDRMHMFHNGKWSSTPPSYDCILTTDGGMKMKKGGKKSNLNDYISMSTTNTSINTNGGKGKELSPMGQVLTMQEMRAKFGQQL